MFPNIQQRDKTLREVQKVLGLAIVPIIALAEMIKTNKLGIKNAKKYVSDAIMLACNAMYEMNSNRRYILKQKRFQQFQHLIPLRKNIVFLRHYKNNEGNQRCFKNQQTYYWAINIFS